MTSKKHPPILGFGFSTEHTEHCFVVTFPDSRAKDADILISEHFNWNPDQEVSVEASFNDRDRQTWNFPFWHSSVNVFFEPFFCE